MSQVLIIKINNLTIKNICYNVPYTILFLLPLVLKIENVKNLGSIKGTIDPDRNLIFRFTKGHRGKKCAYTIESSLVSDPCRSRQYNQLSCIHVIKLISIEPFVLREETA